MNKTNLAKNDEQDDHLSITKTITRVLIQNSYITYHEVERIIDQELCFLLVIGR